jgi:SAM-dependent methyltransferase
VIAALLAAWFALGWMLITEFSYLPGGTLTIWLYDRLAPLYPRKTSAPAYADVATQQRTLLAPLRRLCERRAQPLILDIGCGSGRASLALVRQPWFTGHIVALDLSEAMLAQFRAARETLPAAQRERIEIRRAGAGEFLEQAPEVDACLLLEVGEFIPGFPRLLRTIAARLSAGGLLIVTRPPFPYSLLFPFRAQSWRALARLLRESGFAGIESLAWRPRYAVVHAWRPDTTQAPAVIGSTRSPP